MTNSNKLLLILFVRLVMLSLLASQHLKTSKKCLLKLEDTPTVHNYLPAISRSLIFNDKQTNFCQFLYFFHHFIVHLRTFGEFDCFDSKSQAVRNLP